MKGSVPGPHLGPKEDGSEKVLIYRHTHTWPVILVAHLGYEPSFIVIEYHSEYNHFQTRMNNDFQSTVSML